MIKLQKVLTMFTLGLLMYGAAFASFDTKIVTNFIDSKVKMNGVSRIQNTYNKLQLKINKLSGDKKKVAQMMLDDLKSRFQDINPIIKREQVGNEYKWNLKDLFKNEKEIDDAINKITQISERLATYKGKLSDDKMLLEYLTLNNEYTDIDYNLWIYVSLVKSIDNKNTQIELLSQRCNTVYSTYQKNVSFFQSEIKEFSDEKIDTIISNPLFKNYKPEFESIKLSRENVLSLEQESMLAELSDSYIPFNMIYNNLVDADIVYPTISNSKGEQLSTNFANLTTALRDLNRDYRKEFTEKYYNTFKQYKNTISGLFVSRLKEFTVIYKIRKYDSLVHAMYKHLFLPIETYDNLVNSTKKNLSTFHRYIKIRKEYLGLDKVHYYDTFSPIEQPQKQNYTFQQAKDMILSGFSQMGGNYLSGIVTAFNSNWIDVYPSDTKIGGSNSMMTYGYHPFVLINFTNSFQNIIELAHELGHSMNYYFTSKAQPSSLYGAIYPLEIPSLTNELILLRGLANNAKTSKEKLFYLDRYMSTIYINYWRATMYADFEKQVYDKIWNNEPVNTQVLDELFRKLFKEYYGPDFEYDDYLDHERAIKSDLFNTYYTHVYALSTAAADNIATNIINKKLGYVEKYVEYLSAGMSGKPNELLQKVGIDMTKPDYIQNVSDTQELILNEMETLILKINKSK